MRSGAFMTRLQGGAGRSARALKVSRLDVIRRIQVVSVVGFGLIVFVAILYYVNLVQLSEVKGSFSVGGCEGEQCEGNAVQLSQTAALSSYASTELARAEPLLLQTVASDPNIPSIDSAHASVATHEAITTGLSGTTSPLAIATVTVTSEVAIDSHVAPTSTSPVGMATVTPTAATEVPLHPPVAFPSSSRSADAVIHIATGLAAVPPYLSSGSAPGVSATTYPPVQPSPNPARDGDIPKYLFAVQVYGPNNQYYTFIDGIKVARALKRTLVRIPYIDHSSNLGHYTFKKPTELTFDVDRLDAVLGALGVRTIGDSAFSEALDKSNRTLDFCLQTQTNERYGQICRQLVGGASCKQSFHVDSRNWPEIGDYSEASLRTRFRENVTDVPILSIDTLFWANKFYKPYRRTLLHAGLSYRDEHLQILRGLTHAKGIVGAATAFISAVLGGVEKPSYLAAHWRRADYSDRPNCTNLPQCVDAVSRDDLITLLNNALLTVRSSGELPWSAVPVVYLATNKPVSAEDHQAFAASGYPRVITFNSSIVDPGEPYYVSLIEQEICLRSLAFVSSRISTWSDRVLETRIALGYRHTWSSASMLRSEFDPTPLAIPASALALSKSLSWPETFVCGYEYMGVSHETPTVMSLICPPGTVVSSVVFASYGAPIGVCLMFVTDPRCHDPTSVDVVRELCVGKTACELPVTSTPLTSRGFGMARCETGGFALAVSLQCTLIPPGTP